MGKYEKYVINPSDWGKRKLMGHDRTAMDKLGPLVAFLNTEMIKETDINIFVHYIKVKEGEAPDYVDMHTHDVSQAYVFPDEGLTFEVTLEDETYVGESPACVFIPPGIKHTVKMLKGEGIEVSILRRGEYKF
jgi:hypothetical protein